MKRLFLVILPIAFAVQAQDAGSPATPAPGAAAKPAKPAPVTIVPSELFHVPEGLEATVWATTPQLYNPTNIDFDKDGRLWVAEGVKYRSHSKRRPEGDRIVVLEDTDGDGKADKSEVFAQQEDLVAPLGIAVLGNQVVVSQPPDLLIYTDVNGDRKFDPVGDKREALLSGFNGRNHDHSLHSLTAGPDGLWYFNHGNTGALFTDRSGKTFRIGSHYVHVNGKGVVDPSTIAGQKSDDDRVWAGGFSVRMNSDGTDGCRFRTSVTPVVQEMGNRRGCRG